MPEQPTFTRDELENTLRAWVAHGKNQIEDRIISEQEAKEVPGFNVTITTSFDVLQALLQEFSRMRDEAFRGPRRG